MNLSQITLAIATVSLSTFAVAVLPTATLEPTYQNVPLVAQAPLQRALTNNDFPVLQHQISPVVAQNSQFEQKVTVSIVSLDAQGQESLAPVTAQTKLTSGNILEYRGYIINHSPDRIRSMKVTFDIPTNMELHSLETLSPQRALGSANGQKFQPVPVKANINGVLQNLPNAYYKAVQWDIQGLGLNEVAEVKYRLKVK